MEEMEMISQYIRSRYTEELMNYLKETGIRFPENIDKQERGKKIMKSNFQMIREFKDFKPQSFGSITSEEMDKIKNHFAITERSNVELQNLRDFVVMYYSETTKSLTDSDVMSGIVGVIDLEKANRRMEV